MESQRKAISERVQRLKDTLRTRGIDVLALNPGPTLAYFTGLEFHLMERPVVALFTADADPVVVLPELERSKLDDLPYAYQAFPYNEDLASWSVAFADAAAAARFSGRVVGLEPRRLRVLELRFLEAAAPGARFVSAEDAVAALRMHKDAAEVALMREAVGIAQRALEDVLGSVRPGITERQLAAELTAAMLRQGSEPEFPFLPIVGFGPNSANPHAVPTDRPLEQGDLVLFDWGASTRGYFSDLTRVFSLGEPAAELSEIARVVEAANQAAVRMARPGIPAGALDAAARSVIVEAGYGEYFIHRTGHGLGLEAHEEPYIRAGNDMILAPGMAFTIEPGIYLPGVGGVRIEDNLVVTETGADCLSDMPRGLRRL